MMQKDPIVTINFGDSDGDRHLAFSEARHTLAKYLDVSNIGMAASISMRLTEKTSEKAS